MSNQELLDYIQSTIVNGERKDSVSEKLLNAGWNNEDIQRAYEEIENPNQKNEKNAMNNIQAIASLPRRAFAFLIDLILLLISLAIFGLSGANLSASWNWKGETGLQADITVLEPMAGLALLVAIVIYFILLESTVGASIGKSLLGIRTVNLNKEKASFYQIALKNLVKPIDMILVGFGFALFSNKNQTLGDRIAKTVVVKKSNMDKSFPSQPVSILRKIFGGIIIFMAFLFTVLTIISIPQIKELNNISHSVTTELKSLYPDNIDTIYDTTFSDEFRSQITLEEFREQLQSERFAEYINEFTPANVEYYSWSYNNSQALVRGTEDDMTITLGYIKNNKGEWVLLRFNLNK